MARDDQRAARHPDLVGISRTMASRCQREVAAGLAAEGLDREEALAQAAASLNAVFAEVAVHGLPTTPAQVFAVTMEASATSGRTADQAPGGRASAALGSLSRALAEREPVKGENPAQYREAMLNALACTGVTEAFDASEHYRGLVERRLASELSEQVTGAQPDRPSVLEQIEALTADQQQQEVSAEPTP